MKNKLINAVCLLIGMTVLAAGCAKKGPNYREFTYPAQKADGLSPATGYPGIYVTITGTNFDTLRGAVKVWFGGILASEIQSVNGTQIVVKVPANAVSGKVGLQVWTTANDSIGTFTVIPAPVINSLTSNSPQGSNIAMPGDTLTFTGSGFGTDATKLSVSFNGTSANILTPVQDGTFKVIAPDDFSSGNVTLTIGGLTLTAPTAIINPTAPGDITPYFLGNTGDTLNGGGFTRGDYDGSRWGTLAAPWITNTAALNKSGRTMGGYGREPWSPKEGFLCWETWNNTPITDGIIYQPTSMALPAGNYTLSFKYYSEIQSNSSVHCEVAAGKNGIPALANISSAIASVALANPSDVGSTKPSVTEEKSLDFTLNSSQFVSIGFLANLKWGNETANPGCYVKVLWIKLVKN